MQIIQASPSQLVTILLDVLDGYGTRTAPDTIPIVSRIIFPNFSLASDYPQDMLQLDTGLYYFRFSLPSGAASVGSYIIDVSYTLQEIDRNISYQVICSAPLGNYSAGL